MIEGFVVQVYQHCRSDTFLEYYQQCLQIFPVVCLLLMRECDNFHETIIVVFLVGDRLIYKMAANMLLTLNLLRKFGTTPKINEDTKLYI